MIVIQESPYFFEQEGQLCQAIALRGKGISNSIFTLFADETPCLNLYSFTENVILAPICGASPLKKKQWNLRLEGPEETQSVQLEVGNVRPFSIYIAQDKHLDYGWKHMEHELDFRMDDMADFYLGEYLDHGRKYNFDCLLWLESYVSSHTEKETNDLMKVIAEGGMSVGAFPIIPMTGILSGEELTMALLRARRLSRKFGIPIEAVIPNECPSMTWGLASCLAGMKIPYLARGAYDLANPYIKQRDRIPLFYWEGPDGGRVLVHYNILENIMGIGGYGEAAGLRLKGFEDRVSVIEHAIDSYEAFEDYKPNSFLMLGTGWDDYPRNDETATFIERFNSCEFAYPKLIDASYLDFFHNLENQILGGLELPTLKGDYGCGWEIWGSQLSYASALFRKARRLTLSAQTACAISCFLTGDKREQDYFDLDAAFENLFHFADHNFGGILPAEYDDMRDKKLMYAHNAHRSASRVLERAMGRLKSHANSGDNILVFNPLGWKRSGTATVLTDSGGQWQVFDSEGRLYPTVTETRGVQEEHYTTFFVQELEPYAVRTFRLTKTSDLRCDFSHAASKILENSFFRISFDNFGSVSSIYSKVFCRELLRSSSSYKFNQLIYTYEDTVQNSQPTILSDFRESPLECSLITRSQCRDIQLETLWVLPKYENILRITNRIFRPVNETLSSLQFAFPFDIKDANCKFDSAYASVDTRMVSEGGNMLKGSSPEIFCALTYADLCGAETGVTLFFEDSFLFQRPAKESGTLLSLVQSNFTRNDFIVDQGGQRRFSFAYTLRPYEGMRSVTISEKFAAEQASPLFARLIPSCCPAKGRPSGSFVLEGDSSVLIMQVKPSENKEGILLRLREIEGKTATCTLSILQDFHELWVVSLEEEFVRQIYCAEKKAILELQANEILSLFFRF